MAEHVAVPERNLHPIPDVIDDRRAIFIEPLAAAFRIAEQIAISQGLPIAVVGDGKLGLLCAWALQASGARVTLVGKHPDKLALAGEGIEPIPLGNAAKLGRAFEVVADCSGSPTGLPTALGLVRPLGTVILKTTIAGDYAINLAPIVIDEITVIGSRCGPFPRAIAALASGEVDPTPLLGPEFPLERAEDAFAAASAKGARKVTIIP
jgi:threonine dehydrogenase-like Zn-dependent dehydrogenase